MKLSTKIISATLALSLGATAVYAAAHINSAVGARQAQMSLYGFNIGLLGGMAQGKIDYDADAAAKAASNLAALTALDQSRMWPQGSDNVALGADATRAKPELWANFPDVAAKGMAVNAAAVAMAEAAGGGLDSLRGAIGPLGQACSACHKAYRAPKE